VVAGGWVGGLTLNILYLLAEGVSWIRGELAGRNGKGQLLKAASFWTPEQESQFFSF
jgi:hypothetical protein